MIFIARPFFRPKGRQDSLGLRLAVVWRRAPAEACGSWGGYRRDMRARSWLGPLSSGTLCPKICCKNLKQTSQCRFCTPPAEGRRIEDALRGRTTARPALANGHRFRSRPSCLAIADDHQRRILELGRDLASTWQGSSFLKQLANIFRRS